MALTGYQYQFTPSSGATVTITHNTSFTEQAAAARVTFWTPAGINGEIGLKLGYNGKRGELLAWFHESSESNLQTAKDALDLLVENATVCSVAVRGGADTWANVIVESVNYIAHYVDPLGYYGAQARIVLRQLVPD